MQLKPAIPKLKRGEILWVQGHDCDGYLRYVITSDRLRTAYFLYVATDGEWKIVAKAKTPQSFGRYLDKLDLGERPIPEDD